MEALFIAIPLAIYIALCNGKMAEKLGHSFWRFFLPSLVSPVNMVLLGYLAFTKKGGRYAAG